MMYRHIITAKSNDKELDKKLDRLDQYFYETLNLMPASAFLGSDPEATAKGIKMLNETKDITNDFLEVLIDEHELLNQLDTKLDGLESMLKNIEREMEYINKKSAVDKTAVKTK